MILCASLAFQDDRIIKTSAIKILANFLRERQNLSLTYFPPVADCKDADNRRKVDAHLVIVRLQSNVRIDRNFIHFVGLVPLSFYFLNNINMDKYFFGKQLGKVDLIRSTY